VQPMRSAWTDRSEERRIRRQIRDAPVILEDACRVRFILYPWDRPSARFYASRVEDRHNFKAMSVLIRPGDVVFDVGAYIGVYSVIASRLCLERGKVVAFEPVPATYFLRVDVEGFEKFVFRGAQQLLRNRRIDFICFEISQDPLKGAGVEAREVFTVLGDCGYSTYRFRWDGKGFDGPFDDSTDYWANYFASWRDLAAVSPNQSAKRGRMVSRDGAERSR
jgi:hypothetical protein